MSIVKNENHFVVKGFMVNDLNLKGVELMVYAIIYGFSQDGHSRFTGSRQYLADFTGTSKSTIDRALESLIEKNYIIKETSNRNNIVFNEYFQNEDTLFKMSRGVVKMTTNNIDIYKKENKLYKYNLKESKNFTPPTLDEIKEYCKQRNNNVDPNYFYDFFSVSNWIDSNGKQVKNWKQKIITWERNNQQRNNNSNKGQEIEYELLN